MQVKISIRGKFNELDHYIVIITGVRIWTVFYFYFVSHSRHTRRRPRRHSYNYENLVSIAQRMADAGDAFEMERRLVSAYIIT